MEILRIGKYIVLAIIGVAMLGACKKKKKNAKKVAVEKVGKHTIIETVSAIGKIYPEVEVKISSDVSGEIIDIFFNEGDSVYKGQLLAKINPDLYESGLDQAKASYQNARSQQSSSAASLARVKGALTLAQQTYNRQKKLFDDKVISRSEFEQAENGLTAAKAELNSFNQSLVAQKYTVKSAGARVDEARKNYNRTVVYSPMDGIISAKNSFKGERVVGTSQMAGTEMLRIADMNKMEVRVDVNENDIVRVKIGDTAIVEIDAYDGKEFKGIVTEIANSAKSLTGVGASITTNDVANFVVKISVLPSSYQDLVSKRRPFPFRPGMSATVEIITARKHKTTSIPSGAVGLRKLTKEGKPDRTKRTSGEELNEEERAKQVEVVFVNKAGKIEQRQVKTGLQDAEYVEILDGIEEGEEIVVYPFMAISKTLKDGEKVDVTEKSKVFSTK